MHDREELLSAYYDGALSEAERRAVEVWLAESGAARQTLDEFGEISALVRSLSRPAAPRDLAAGVLRDIRSESPAAASRAVSRPATRAPQRRGLRWGWGAVVAASLLTVVAIWQLDPRDRRQPADKALARSGVESSPRLETSAVAPVNWGRMLDAAVDTLQLQQLVADGRLPVPGELLPDFREVDGQLIIIEYSVVDVQEMYGQVQVVLARNGIRMVSEDGRLTTALDDTTGRLYGIYIDADSDNFVAALDALHLLNGVVAVTTNEIEDAIADLGDSERASVAESAVAAAAPESRSLKSDVASADAPLGSTAQGGALAPAAPRTRATGNASDLRTADEELLRPQIEDATRPAERRGGEGAREFDGDRSQREDYQLPVPLRDDVVRQLVVSESTAELAGDAASASGSDRAAQQASRAPQRKDAPQSQDQRSRRRGVIVFVPKP